MNTRPFSLAAVLLAACLTIASSPLAALAQPPAPTPGTPAPAAPTDKGKAPPRVRPPQASRLPPDAMAIKDVVYAEVGGKKLLMDIYMPEGAKEGSAPWPVLVWIHGGGWQAGSKEAAAGLFMLPKGFVVVSIDYRLSQDATWPAQIHDCKGAIRFLRAHAKDYHIDPERIGVWGASAGGHLAAMLGVTGDNKDMEGDVGGNLSQSSRVQAVCDWFGPTDFSLYVILDGDERSVGPMIRHLLGGTQQEKPEAWKTVSPIDFVSKGDPPFLIMQGDQDQLVPHQQSEDFAAKLKEAGVSVDLRILKGAGHGNGGFASPESRDAVAEFFEKQLKPAAGGGKPEASASKTSPPK